MCKNFISILFLCTAVIIYSCEKDDPNANIQPSDNNNVSSELICEDVEGLWQLDANCPTYELPALNIEIDVESRFEDTIPLTCYDDDRILIQFYGQTLYANMDTDGTLTIPSQEFQADFSQEGLELDILDENLNITIQIDGDGDINENSGTVNVNFSFTLIDDFPFEEMTSCVLNLNR